MEEILLASAPLPPAKKSHRPDFASTTFAFDPIGNGPKPTKSFMNIVK